MPAKSGVSGSIYVVIPDFGSICIYSPPLDQIGNSVRGVEFFKRLIEVFNFHTFDSMQKSVNSQHRIDPRINRTFFERDGKITAFYAAAEGDLAELQRMIRSGISPNTTDYDKRSLLHLAASNGHYRIVKYLIKFPDIEIDVQDRWGGTPFSDAERYKHTNIMKLLEQVRANGNLSHSPSNDQFGSQTRF
jgi:glutaminase